MCLCYTSISFNPSCYVKATLFQIIFREVTRIRLFQLLWCTKYKKYTVDVGLFGQWASYGHSQYILSSTNPNRHFFPLSERKKYNRYFTWQPLSLGCFMLHLYFQINFIGPYLSLRGPFFPPASGVEGIKSVPSVCPCVCLCVCLSFSSLTAEPFDIRTSYDAVLPSRKMTVRRTFCLEQ